MRPAVILAIIAFICSSGVVLVNHFTHQRIDTMREQKIVQQLHDVLPAGLYNNQLIEDSIQMTDPLLGSTSAQTIWRARTEGKPVAAILSATAPDGYSGPITLLIAITLAGESTGKLVGELAGVRVVTHRETPGLGDEIELTKSEWILGFAGHSLLSLPESAWRVKKDGGHFEHFTGATITPRAITSAVHSALIFFRENQEAIFATNN